MQTLTFPGHRDSELSILCLGAHSDDIEIGCGATILKLAQAYPQCCIHWVVFCASETRASEAWKSASLFLDRIKNHSVYVENFRDGFLPYTGWELKEYFERLKYKINPDVIFTHYRNDLHEDHREICELTWNVFRNHLILEYEIPKYDGDLGSPNLFVPIQEDLYQKKIRYIFESFQSQQSKGWFTEDTFSALARLRGVEAGSVERYAEAFYTRKILWFFT